MRHNAKFHKSKANEREIKSKEMLVQNIRMKIPRTCHHKGRNKGKPKKVKIVNRNVLAEDGKISTRTKW